MTTGPDPVAALRTTAAGVLVVDKPDGWTSHQVVGRVRRILGTRKVGHAGTLDPMATGVLVVGVNRATRLLGHFAAGRKSYAATIRLGADTVTDDADGEPTRTPGAGSATAADVAAQLLGFVGAIAQRPSAVSAIKVDGVRSYARVRAGEQVELPERQVTVHAYALGDVRPVEVDGIALLDCDVTVDCSAGTYIRALARDLGERLGTGGHLTALRRTAVEPFTLDDAVTLDALAEHPTMIDIDTVARRCFTALDLDVEQAAHVRFGRALPGLTLPADLGALFDPDGGFLALYRADGDRAVPVSVFVGS
ncbi:MAG: tRNA pseudouridine(55) synthase TruB [Propionibacteriaceae bacterium]